MARAKLSILSAISGTVDSTEYAMTRNGLVLKKRKPRRRLDSPAQIDARAVFHRRIADWHSMTDAAKTEWNAYAATHPITNRLGLSKYITGFNWFMKLRDTDDGILLPIATATPPIFGTPTVYYGGPYTFPITWPAESTDDWKIQIWFGVVTRVSGEYWPKHYKSAGVFLKSDISNLNYATLDALGISFTPDNWYMIRGYVVGPRYFPSTIAFNTFYALPPVQYSFHLAMDDNLPTTTVVDAYGHHDQTFEGTNPNTEDHSVAGVHDLALHFNGSDNQIVLTTAAYQAYMGEYADFTLAAWWKPDTPIGVSYKDILSSYAFTAPHVRFAIKQDRSIISIGARWSGSNYYTNANWASGDVSVWQHFAIVRNGKNLKLYADGVKVLDSTQDYWQGAFYWTGNDLSIGSRQGIDNHADGAADDVYLFDHALSDAEVAALAVP